MFQCSQTCEGHSGEGILASAWAAVKWRPAQLHSRAGPAQGCQRGSPFTL